MLSIPAYPSDQLIDPTGAGDSFAGGLLGYLSQSINAADHPTHARVEIDRKDFVQALLQGTAIASYTIEAFSIERLQQVTHKDIQRRVAELQALMGN
jgi:sugar/nucleoside kinase (ribokinase family)